MTYEIKFHEQQEGWTHEVLDRDCVFIQRPSEIGGGFVTIDFKRRIFATGMGVPRFAPLRTSSTEAGIGSSALLMPLSSTVNDVMS